MLKALVGNLLARSEVGIVMTPASDPFFPERFLADGPGQLGARFGTTEANPYIDIDLNGEIGEELAAYSDGGSGPDDTSIAANGDAPDIETTISGSSSPEPNQGGELTMSNLQDHGSNGFSLLSFTSYEFGVVWTETIKVVRGKSYRFGAWVMNDTATGCRVRFYNATTGHYLKTDGTWSASPQDIAVDTSTDMVWVGMDEIDAVIEGDGPAESDLQILRIQDGGAGFCFFDDVSVAISPETEIPETDFFGVFNGHNIPIGTIIYWTSDNDPGFGTATSRGTFTVVKHQFYLELQEPFQARYHRFQIVGTPNSQYWISDLVLGLLDRFPKEARDGVNVEYPEIGQIRQQAPAGSRRIQNRGPYPPRHVSVGFRFATAEEEAEFRAFFVDQLRGGAESVVLIPAADLEGTARVAVYGDIDQPLSFQHNMAGAHQTDEPERFDYYSDVDISVDEGAGFAISEAI